MPLEPSRWRAAKRLETAYFRRLRGIAINIRQIVEGFPEAGADPHQTDELEETLRRYADVLRPWARREAERMTYRIAEMDEKMWLSNSLAIRSGLRELLNNSSVGAIMRQRSEEQAELITSLPSKAAKAVRELTIEGLQKGERAENIVTRIQRMGDVTKGRAKLIARTEVARTASMLTQHRSGALGCTHYIWRTSRDDAVRKSHRLMEGVVCEWASPPTLTDGTTTHAGQIYNCRCYPEPIIPDYILGRR
jgi:SPP1 gp7 family putative phage head morphogenesis protein